PAGVVCEIMNEDGTMARVPDLVPYCEPHGLRMITVADLIEYRRRTEKLVQRVVSVRLPTEYGLFTATAFREALTGREHLRLDTVGANLALGFAADEREWGIRNEVLAELGVEAMRVLTNDAMMVSGVEVYGLRVAEQVPIEVPPHPENVRYLAATRDKRGHKL